MTPPSFLPSEHYNALGAASTNRDLLLTNSKDGRASFATVRFATSWDMGLSIDGSYTRSDVDDQNAITSTTAASLYNNNAMIDPNTAAYGRSIYEITDPTLAVTYVTRLASDLQDPPARPRSASSAAPSSAGAPRSPRGTARTSPTGRPRRSTT